MKISNTNIIIGAIICIAIYKVYKEYQSRKKEHFAVSKKTIFIGLGVFIGVSTIITIIVLILKEKGIISEYGGL